MTNILNTIYLGFFLFAVVVFMHPHIATAEESLITDFKITASPWLLDKKIKNDAQFCATNHTDKKMRTTPYILRISKMNSNGTAATGTKPIVLRGKIKKIPANDSVCVTQPLNKQAVVKKLREGMYELILEISGDKIVSTKFYTVKKKSTASSALEIGYTISVPENVYSITQDSYPGVGRDVTSLKYSSKITGKTVFLFQYPPREIGYELAPVVEQTTTSWNGAIVDIVTRKYNEPGLSSDAGFIILKTKEATFIKDFSLFVYFGPNTSFATSVEAKAFALNLLKNIKRK